MASALDFSVLITLPFFWCGQDGSKNNECIAAYELAYSNRSVHINLITSDKQIQERYGIITF